MLSMVSMEASAHDFEVDGIYYNITSTTENTVEVTYKGDNYSSSAYSGSVVIPESVTYGEVTYSVTTIGSYAFYNYSGLTSVTIGNSVTSIGTHAFYGCDSLLSVTSLIESPFIIRSVFFVHDTLYVPKGTKALYEACRDWNEFSNIIEIELSSIDQQKMINKGEAIQLRKNYYDLNGRRISEPQRGLNILRMSDGSVRKVIKK